VISSVGAEARSSLVGEPSLFGAGRVISDSFLRKF